MDLSYITRPQPDEPPPPQIPEEGSPAWHKMIGAVVVAVAGRMVKNRVDPRHVTPEDAWFHYTKAVRSTLSETGEGFPAIWQEFLRDDGPMERAFKFHWNNLELQQLQAGAEYHEGKGFDR